jgi:acylphosphatase
MTTLHLLIAGHVQGIGYRNWMVHEARRLGIAGWVRNTGDTRVEAVVQGPGDAIDAILRACRQGPPYALVETEPAPDETPWRSVHPVAAKQPPRQAHQGDQAEVKTDHGGKPCPDEPELSGQVPDFRTRCRKVKVFLLLFLQKKKSLVLF